MARQVFSGLDIVVLSSIAMVTVLVLLINRTQIYKAPNESDTNSAQSDRSATQVTVDWYTRFSFVPFNVQDCTQLFNGNDTLPQQLVNNLVDHQAFVTDVVGTSTELQGFSANKKFAFKTFTHIVDHAAVRSICETGFNAGHSTLGWLTSNPTAHVYSFDIGDHTYSRPIAAHLKQLFPGRLTVTWGDSIHTLDQFRRHNPEVRCDVTIIDGGHTEAVARADFDNFRLMASEENIVIMDNYPQPNRVLERLGPVWEGGKRNRQVSEIFSCVHGHSVYGFSVGRFNV